MYCLIVDDDEDARYIAEKIIGEHLGFFTKTASNADEALDLCARQLPQVIMLDWNMPGMNGLEFIDKLRRTPLGYKVNVIMCTANNDRMYVEEALAAGAKGFIVKPYNIRNVIKQFAYLGIKAE